MRHDIETRHRLQQSGTSDTPDPLIKVIGPAAKNRKARRRCLTRPVSPFANSALQRSSAAVAGDIQSLTALGGAVPTVATVIRQNTIKGPKGPQMQVLNPEALGRARNNHAGILESPQLLGQ